MLYISIVSRDDASSTSASVDPKLDLITRQTSKPGEGGDENNMTDLSVTVNMQILDSALNFMDASMQQPPQDEHQVGDIDEGRVGDAEKNKVGDIDEPEEVKMMTLPDSSDISTREALNMLPCGIAAEHTLEAKPRDSLVLDLQNALEDKSNQCFETENKLKAAMVEIISLRRDLEFS